MEGLAGVIFLAAVLFPLAKLLASVWVLGLARAGRLTRARVFRSVERLHPWAMTEVYCSASSLPGKLRDSATRELGLGIIALAALILVMAWADSALEPHEVWTAIESQARAADVTGCHACRQLVLGGDPRGGRARPLPAL